MNLQFVLEQVRVMTSLAFNSFMPNFPIKQTPSLGISPIGPKPAILERTHFSSGGGSSGGGYHHHHHHGAKGGSNGKKHGLALTALTLLAFLFFLNILQNCLQDQMNDMNQTQQVIIMQARISEARETEEAQRRKGEDSLANTTILNKESRHVGPKETTTETLEKIPIKLKTIKYIRKP